MASILYELNTRETKHPVTHNHVSQIHITNTNSKYIHMYAHVHTLYKAYTYLLTMLPNSHMCLCATFKYTYQPTNTTAPLFVYIIIHREYAMFSGTVCRGHILWIHIIIGIYSYI